MCFLYFYSTFYNMYITFKWLFNWAVTMSLPAVSLTVYMRIPTLYFITHIFIFYHIYHHILPSSFPTGHIIVTTHCLTYTLRNIQVHSTPIHLESRRSKLHHTSAYSSPGPSKPRDTLHILRSYSAHAQTRISLRCAPSLFFKTLRSRSSI